MFTQKNEDDFDNTYTMDDSVISPEGAFDDGRLETYGKDDELARQLADSKRLWTAIDGDEGMYYIAGYHRVNRIYYLVTKEEYSSEDEEYCIEEYEVEED